MSRLKLTKAEKREQKNLKRKNAPKGATLSDQLKSAKIHVKKTKIKVKIK